MKKSKNLSRILVVEDNPGDFGIIEDFLNDQIADPFIVHATHFKEASAFCSIDGYRFDVILLDLTLPDKSGQDLVTAILRIASYCPIIILTGFGDIAFSIRSISQGISDYLIKDDLNATILFKSITYAIERKKTISHLEESEKRYSDLFHLSPQPMWVLNPGTSRFVQVNQAAIGLYGYNEDEFLNMTLSEIMMDDEICETRELARTRSREAGIFKRVILHHKKSGEVIEVEIYSTPIMIEDNSFTSVIAIDVTEKNQHEHKIVKAIIKAQEDERYEIGGELHDNVCQILAASQLNLDMLKDQLPAEEMVSFERCAQNISLALDEIRNLSHRLAPAFFDDTTLEEAFERLFNSFDIGEKMEIFLHLHQAVKEYPISPELQINLYRILQEQLKNILKYANAAVIEVEMLIHKHRLTMRISDNGVGFNVDKARTGIGLANMKRRAELFSGKFEIYSIPGSGCEIIVDIPLAPI